MVWMREVHLHLIETYKIGDRLPELGMERMSERLRSAAISRLGSLEVGYRPYDLALKMLVDCGHHFGRLTDTTCSSFGLRSVCLYCSGGLSFGSHPRCFLLSTVFEFTEGPSSLGERCR